MKSTFIHPAWVLGALCACGLTACSGDASDDANPGDPNGSNSSAITSCDGSSTSDFTLIDENITEDATWSGTVYVEGAVKAASGAVLTVEPGTQVVMAQDSSLDFATEADAALMANGSQSKPVQFCGEQAEAGYWAGVALDAAGRSHLENVLIANAGQAEGAALTLNGPATLQQVEVNGSAADGIHASDFAEASSDVVVKGNAAIGLVLTAEQALAHMPSEIEFSGNTDDRVRVRFETIEQDVSVPALDVAYVQEGALKVKNSATFELQAGVNYLFDTAASLEIGAEGESATALFLGSEDNPVICGGAEDTSGYWQGIMLMPSASIDSMLSHVEIRHAGADGHAALDAQAAITVDHVLVSESETGVRVGHDGLSADSDGLEVTGTAGVPLQVEANALVNLPQAKLSGNADDRVMVEGGEISSSGTIVDLGVSYAVMGDLDTVDACALNIEPGVVFVMADDTRFTVGADGSAASISAEGTSEAMIEFRGASDDAGAWYGITIGSNVTADSSLQYCEIRDAGGDGLLLGAALTLETAIEVSDSVFVNSAGNGILKLSTDDSDYASANTFTDVQTEVGVTTEAALEELH